MEKPEVRLPAVAGQFYPGTSAELLEALAGFRDPAAVKTDAIGCMLPHAGYMYSGAVAGAAVSRLIPKGTIFLLGPNHTGYGTPFSVMASGAWQTPLGQVPVDATLARALIGSSDIFCDDVSAHVGEHSLEVELPFFQEAFKEFSIVPLTIASDDAAALREAGAQIGALILRQGIAARTLICASSDMSHYEPRDSARRKDMAAIEAVCALDAARLLKVVRQQDITMCGYAPTAVMLEAAKALGATKGEVVKYQDSGDVTGDRSSVVGYAGIIIH